MKTTIRTVELLEGTDIVFHPNDFTRNPLLYNTTQIGHVVCGEKHSVSRNGYSSFGIYSVTEGTVKLTTKNGAFYAEKGDLLFFDQSEKHLVENGGSQGTASNGPIVKAKTVGRNDPCPCGSGLKFKNCCGKHQ